MQRLVLTSLVTLTILLMAPALMLAQEQTRSVEEPDPTVEARIQGYSENVAVEGNTIITWLIFIVLTVVCLGVLFKDSNRSHLD